MISTARYLLVSILSSLLFPVLLILLYAFQVINTEFLSSVIAGWGIVFLGFVFEMLFIKKGIKKSDKSFIRNILGVVLVRLFLMLALVFTGLVFLELNQNNFIFSTLFFFLFYLIIEILYLNLRNN
jgi:hypothetical protein